MLYCTCRSSARCSQVEHCSHIRGSEYHRWNTLRFHRERRPQAHHVGLLGRCRSQSPAVQAHPRYGFQCRSLVFTMACLEGALVKFDGLLVNPSLLNKEWDADQFSTGHAWPIEPRFPLVQFRRLAEFEFRIRWPSSMTFWAHAFNTCALVFDIR